MFVFVVVWLVSFQNRNGCCTLDEKNSMHEFAHKENCDTNCKEFSSEFKKLAGSLKKLKVGNVVVEDSQELVKALGVDMEGVPNLKLFKTKSPAAFAIMDGHNIKTVDKLRKRLKFQLKEVTSVMKEESL